MTACAVKHYVACWSDFLNYMICRRFGGKLFAYDGRGSIGAECVHALECLQSFDDAL